MLSSPAGRLLSATVVVATILLAGTLSACSGAGGDSSILDDGIVTQGEYRQAVEADVECLHNAGFDTSDIREANNHLLLTFDIRLTSDDAAAADRSSAAQDSCYADHLKEVEKAYFEQNIPSGADRDRMFDDLIACLEAAGVTGVTHADTEQQIVKKLATQRGGEMSDGLFCIDEYRLVFPDGMFPE